MKFGLTDRDIGYILKGIRTFPEIEEVVIFGSRAMGNYKKGSDIDLAVKGSRVDMRVISKLTYLLDEKYPIPYFFDVVSYDKIKNPDLIKHIDDFGKTIFRR